MVRRGEAGPARQDMARAQAASAIHPKAAEHSLRARLHGRSARTHGRRPQLGLRGHDAPEGDSAGLEHIIENGQKRRPWRHGRLPVRHGGKHAERGRSGGDGDAGI